MIPKIVHYCWLSGDPIPADLQKWMQTWKEKLPDWDFILWDKTRFDINSVEWVRQAYEQKKYAFAADYIRQYAVYTHGGIYMDMDVEVVKSFDPYLNREYILGAETDTGIEAGVFGAEKGSPVIKSCLDWYDGKSFVNDDGTLNIRGCPKVMMQAIGEIFKVRISDVYTPSIECVSLMPRDYLTAKSSETGVVTKTQNTITVHHFAGSWMTLSGWGKIKLNTKKILGRILGENMVKILLSIRYKLMK